MFSWVTDNEILEMGSHHCFSNSASSDDENDINDYDDDIKKLLTQ